MSPTKTATIFDIQSFSLHDGPGIRTTVFFKGCPLRCLWCHNPESLSKKPQMMFHQNLCTACMKCASVCPARAHDSSVSNGHMFSHEACTGCRKCIGVCCYDALAMIGGDYSPAQLLHKIRSDFSTYGKEGGITFSGGEPMQWSEFILAFLALIPGIHTAIDTSGHAPSAHFRQLAGKINLYLFDYKATNPQRHMELTGVDNRLILQNLSLLYGLGANIILRLPLIPGVNDDDAHMKGIAGLLKQYPRILHAEIMPYHNLGESKRAGLGMTPKQFSGVENKQKDFWLNRLHELGANNVILSR